MNREIKFRAWWEKEKQMFGVRSIDWSGISGMRVNLIGADTVDINELILMQYTGLKDKNGMEIYEGDICRDSLGWIFEVFCDVNNGRFLGRHSKPRGEIYICYVDREPSVEIIGNIYENPELLKEKSE